MSSRTPNLAEVIRAAFDNRLADVHVMLPGKIDSFDAATQKADVQPLIRRLQETESGGALSESLPVIPSVPVVWWRAGDFKITMPVKKGNRCMLIFCESSIDNYQTGKGTGEVDPESFERFNLTDAVALMGWYTDAEALEETDPDDLVLAKDGGEAIHIGRGKINLFEKDAAQPVGLADDIKSELDKAKGNAQKAIDFASQIKAVIGTGVGISGDGGAAIAATQLTAAQLILAPTLDEPSSVAAQKVFAT